MYKPSISVVSTQLLYLRNALTWPSVSWVLLIVWYLHSLNSGSSVPDSHDTDRMVASGCHWLVLEKPHFQRHTFNATHVTREIGRIGTIHREFAFLGLADGAGDSFSASESAVP
jgi:hypothetical protein